MDTKYTPGPWEARRNSSYWEIVPFNSGNDGIPHSVADACPSAPGFPDAGLQEANARLIAAAPELLEAAESATECDEILGNLIDSIKQHGNYTAESTLLFLDHAKSCLADLQKAIAKATGKAG